MTPQPVGRSDSILWTSSRQLEITPAPVGLCPYKHLRLNRPDKGCLRVRLRQAPNCGHRGGRVTKAPGGRLIARAEWPSLSRLGTRKWRERGGGTPRCATKHHAGRARVRLRDAI